MVSSYRFSGFKLEKRDWISSIEQIEPQIDHDEELTLNWRWNDD